jgi:hypothetical protein
MESHSPGTPASHLRVVIGDDADDHAEEPLHTDSVAALAVPEELPQPAYGVRAEQPGERGCWTRKANGELCGAARRADGDYCNAHSGLGVAKNPAEWSAVGAARSADSRRRRAALRLELGISRPNSLRGLLKAATFAERERIVGAALAGLDDPSPSRRTSAALALLNAVEPQPKAALQVDIPTDPDGVSALGLSQLRALAEQVGLDPSPPQAQLST